MTWSRSRGPCSAACPASTTSRPAHQAAMPPAWRKGQQMLHSAKPEHVAQLSPPSPQAQSRARGPCQGLKEGDEGVRRAQQCWLCRRASCARHAAHVGSPRPVRAGLWGQAGMGLPPSFPACQLCDPGRSGNLSQPQLPRLPKEDHRLACSS